MVNKYLDKKAKNRVKAVDTPNGKLLSEKKRDDDDNLIWVDDEVVTSESLQRQIEFLTGIETNQKAEAVKTRATITNLQDIKTDLFQSLK